MTSKIILPQSTVSVFHLIKRSGKYHPGLLFDKYSPTGKEKQKKSSLDDFAKAANESGRIIPPHRAEWLKTLPADCRFSAKLVTPLALHLSRASALEDAGLCMHPIHGLVYLPGSGLKGMARAFAETVWLHTHTDPEEKKEAWQQIEDVFGWAPPLPTARRRSRILIIPPTPE